MSGIDELKQMLESRSTEYGKMRQILSFYLLGIDKERADIQGRLKVGKDALERIAHIARLGSAEHSLALGALREIGREDK